MTIESLRSAGFNAGYMAKEAGFGLLEDENSSVLGMKTIPIGGFSGRPTFEQRADASGGFGLSDVLGFAGRAAVGGGIGGLFGAAAGFAMGASPFKLGMAGAATGAIVNSFPNFFSR
jgi:hypothetical protein